MCIYILYVCVFDMYKEMCVHISFLRVYIYMCIFIFSVYIYIYVTSVSEHEPCFWLPTEVPSRGWPWPLPKPTEGFQGPGGGA